MGRTQTLQFCCQGCQALLMQLGLLHLRVQRLTLVVHNGAHGVGVSLGGTHGLLLARKPILDRLVGSSGLLELGTLRLQVQSRQALLDGHVLAAGLVEVAGGLLGGQQLGVGGLGVLLHQLRLPARLRTGRQRLLPVVVRRLQVLDGAAAAGAVVLAGLVDVAGLLGGGVAGGGLLPQPACDGGAVGVARRVNVTVVHVLVGALMHLPYARGACQGTCADARGKARLLAGAEAALLPAGRVLAALLGPGCVPALLGTGGAHASGTHASHAAILDVAALHVAVKALAGLHTAVAQVAGLLAMGISDTTLMQQAGLAGAVGGVRVLTAAAQETPQETALAALLVGGGGGGGCVLVLVALVEKAAHQATPMVLVGIAVGGDSSCGCVPVLVALVEEAAHQAAAMVLASVVVGSGLVVRLTGGQSAGGLTGSLVAIALLVGEAGTCGTGANCTGGQSSTGAHIVVQSVAGSLAGGTCALHNAGCRG
mmetsp:Transcript_8557/g.25616  ORF Transcript_8557/g.25616 Transcript_8557/m.25616 type:complete len:482 (-) Transcript_8557:142-1587(-)